MKIVTNCIVYIFCFSINCFCQGAWISRANVPGKSRSHVMGDTINGKFYFCGGRDSIGTHLFEQWEYNPINDLWSSKSPMPVTDGKIGGFGLSVNGKMYYGLGYCQYYPYGTCGREVFEYDPVTDIWISKANFPSCPRSLFFSFAIGNKIYIATGNVIAGCGANNTGYMNEVWEFDPIQNNWSQKNNFPGIARNGACGFVINGKAYMIGGSGVSNSLSDVWEYDPSLDNWSQKGNFIGGSVLLGTAFCIGSDGYVVNTNNTFWKYTQSLDAWTQLTSLPFNISRNATSSFSIGNKGYVTLGESYTPVLVEHNDLWEYNFNCPVNVPNMVSSYNAPTVYCGTTVLDSVGADSVLYPNVLYQWYQSTNGTSYTLIPNSNLAKLRNLNITQTTSFKRYVSVNTLCSDTSSPITISILPFVHSNITPLTDTFLCYGDTAILYATPSDTRYWLKNGNYLPDTSQILKTTSSGNYKIISANWNGCNDTSQEISILFYPRPIATITSVGNTLQTTQNNSYQWYLNNVVIPGATSQSFSPQQSGIYSVVVTNSFGCRDSSFGYNYIVSTLENQPSNYAKQVWIYPNPATNCIYIENNINETLILVIKNIQSSFSKTITIKDGVNKLDISSYGLNAGIYTISIYGKNYTKNELLQLLSNN